MQKFLILLSLFSFSVQVDHCFIEEKVCKECKKGFYLVDNKYCTKIEHCRYIPYENTCTDCEKDYKWNSETSLCELMENHCLNYDTDEPSKCVRCQSGYTLNSDETGCTQITPHCIYSFDESTCSSCEDGYALNPTKNECVEFDYCDELNDGGTECESC